MERSRVDAVDVTVDPNQIEGARACCPRRIASNLKDVRYVVGCYHTTEHRQGRERSTRPPPLLPTRQEPSRELADAEPYFNGGPLAGLKVIGWAI